MAKKGATLSPDQRAAARRRIGSLKSQFNGVFGDGTAPQPLVQLFVSPGRAALSASGLPPGLAASSTAVPDRAQVATEGRGPGLRIDTYLPFYFDEFFRKHPERIDSVAADMAQEMGIPERLAAEIREKIRLGLFSMAEYFPVNGDGGEVVTIAQQLDSWIKAQRIEVGAHARLEAEHVHQNELVCRLGQFGCFDAGEVVGQRVADVVGGHFDLLAGTSLALGSILTFVLVEVNTNVITALQKGLVQTLVCMDNQCCQRTGQS